MSRYQNFLKKNPICVKCESIWNVTVDHIIPISKGGKRNSSKNWQPLCYGCNQRKGNSLEEIEG